MGFNPRSKSCKNNELTHGHTMQTGRDLANVLRYNPIPTVDLQNEQELLCAQGSAVRAGRTTSRSLERQSYFISSESELRQPEG